MTKSDLEDLFAMQLRVSGLPEFIEEHRFHSTRRWRFDYAHMGFMIAVELEGGVWSGGRHTRGSGFTKDCEKYNEAQKLGWRVFRFTTQMVQSGDAIAFLEEVILLKGTDDL